MICGGCFPFTFVLLAVRNGIPSSHFQPLPQAQNGRLLEEVMLINYLLYTLEFSRPDVFEIATHTHPTFDSVT